MDMKSALRVMSEQPDGHFVWKGQIVQLYNLLSVDDVDDDVSIEELVRRVNELDESVKDAFFSVKVDFRPPPQKVGKGITLHHKVALSIIFFMLYLLFISGGGGEEGATVLLSLLKAIVDALTNS